MQTRKGAAKETAPIQRLARHSRRNCGTSTSAPARKVRTIPANDPRKASQSGTPTSNALWITTPSASSISATEMPSSTEIVDAARIADARMTAIASSLNLYLLGKSFGGRGHQPGEGRLSASLIARRTRGTIPRPPVGGPWRSLLGERFACEVAHADDPDRPPVVEHGQVAEVAVEHRSRRFVGGHRRCDRDD